MSGRYPERKRSRDRRGDERRGDERRGDGRRGDDRKGDERRGDDRKGDDRKGDDRKGDERRGEDRKGDDRKGDDRKNDERRSTEKRSDDRRERRHDDRPREDKRVRRDESPPKTNRGRSLRIDRHECRKAAIEFLIHNYETMAITKDVLEPMISSHIRSLNLDQEYYPFTAEILCGLLVDRKYTVIADRWIMGILDEHLQAELRVPDLSILRVAGYELLTHPEIPTTVVINEVNVLAKMYCPEKQSLIHAAVNRMIETQLSIGNEIAMENGVANERKSNPLSALIGLDQEAQLAMILLDQQRHEDVSRTRSVSPVRETKPAAIVAKPKSGAQQFKIKFLPKTELPAVPTEANGYSKDAFSQTVRDPTIEPGSRIFKV